MTASALLFLGSILNGGKQAELPKTLSGDQHKTVPTYVILDNKNDRMRVVQGDSVSQTFKIITGKDKGDKMDSLNIVQWAIQKKGLQASFDSVSECIFQNNKD